MSKKHLRIHDKNQITEKYSKSYFEPIRSTNKFMKISVPIMNFYLLKIIMPRTTIIKFYFILKS